MVPDLGGGVRAAGNFPAAQVLGADGEAEELGGVGLEAVEVGGHFFGVVLFVGECGVVGCDLVWVGLVRLVDEREGARVACHCGGFAV